MKKNILLFIVITFTYKMSAQPSCISYVKCLAVSGSNIFAGTNNGVPSGVFLSTNNGGLWTAVNTGLTSTTVLSLAISGTNIFAGTYNGGVFLSTNNGGLWTQVNSGLTSLIVNALTSSGGNIIAGTNDGVFVSSNNGNTWTHPGLTGYHVSAFAITGNTVYASTLQLGGTGNSRIFVSNNNGVTWNNFASFANADVTALATDGINIFAGFQNGMQFFNGTTWSFRANSGAGMFTITYSYAIKGGLLFIGNSAGVYVSSDNGITSTLSSPTFNGPNALAISGNDIFAGSANKGVFLSSDNGASWSNPSIPVTPVINGGNITVCPGQSTTLTVTNPCSGCAYNWSNGMTGQSISINTAGTYTVIGTNVCPSDQSNSQTFNFYSTVYRPVITVIDSSCNGSPATLTANYANPSDVAGYLWSNGSTSQNMTTSLSGNYTVQVLTIQNSCTTLPSLPVSFPVMSVYPPTITTIDSSYNGSAATLQANYAIPSYVSGYLWSNGLTTQSIVDSLPGNYSVQIITTHNGCTTPSSLPIALPVTPIITGNIAWCPGQATVFSVTNPCSGCTYNWSNGMSGQSVSINTPGIYYVRAHNNCGTSRTSDSLTLRAVYTPTVTVLGSLCNGLDGVLSANYTNPLDIAGYLWSNGSTTRTITTSVLGNYSVQVLTVQGGCTSTSSQSIALPVIANCAGRIILEADTVINYFDTLSVIVKIENADNLFSTFAKLHFDNYRMRLISSEVGDFLGTNIINQPPIVTGGGIDFGMTKTNGQPGSSGDGIIYTFKFTLTNLDTNVLFDAVNPNSTFTLFALTNQTVYDASGALRNVDMPPVDTTYLRYYVPVWPGDLNNDKNVNVADILPIGFFYGKNGPTRPNGSLQWVAQPAKLWAPDKTYTFSPAYRVFADGNGNGLIDLADQSAIGFNLGNVHSLTINGNVANSARSVNPPLIAEITETQIDSTQFPYSLSVHVKVGDINQQVDSVLGMAFELQFDPECVDTTNITTNYSNVFGTLNSTFIKIEDYSGKRIGKVGIGITRYNVSSISLNGDEVVTVNFKLNNGCYDGWFNINPRLLACNNDYGASISLESQGDSVRVVKTNNQPSGVRELTGEIEMSLIPNPAKDVVEVVFTQSIPENGYDLMMFDITGKMVLTEKLNKRNTILNVADWVHGIYIAEIKNKEGSVRKRWVKM